MNPNPSIEEEILLEISKITKMPPENIGKDIPINSLGIDSLAGIALLDKLETRHGVEISAEGFFQGLTINDICAAIKEHQSQQQPSSMPVSSQENIKEIPFSSGQKGIWITEKLSNKPINNEPGLVSIEGEMSCQLMKQAIEMAVNQNELLKSHVIMREGQPYLSIRAYQAINVEFCDLTQEPDRLEEVMYAFIETKFDLMQGPPVRFKIIRINDTHHYLVCVFHHLCEDGWSATVFFEELAEIYDALLAGKSVKIKEKKSYLEFVQNQKAFIEDFENEAMKFWRLHLKQPEVPISIGDHERPSVRSHKSGVVDIQLTAQLSKSILEYCQKKKVTPNTFFLSMLFAQLYIKSHQMNVRVGVPLLNRQKNKFLDTFGFFINVLPIVQQLNDHLTLEQVMENIASFFIEVKKYEPFPYPTIVQELRLEPNPAYNPIFQVMYIYEPNLQMRNFSMGNLRASAKSIESQNIKFDLEMKVVLKEEIFSIFYKYNRDIFEHETLENYIHELSNLIERFIDNPTLRVGHYYDLAKSNLDFSLFYFSSCDKGRESQKYNLLLESVKLADSLGIEAVWLPERHFDPFGGLFPNPASLLSYIASFTKKIKLRTGSIILPLHHPLKVAEELSLLDNLSNGRVEPSFTTGWNPNDFVYSPESYAKRREITYENIEIIQKLWKGESIEFKNGKGELVPYKIYPTPVQNELNAWLTCADNPLGFEDAGRLGHNVLTAMLFQNVQELGDKIKRYRDSLKKHHPGKKGHVTVMLHTFLGENLSEVKEIVRKPLYEYLASSYNLWAPHSKQLSDLQEEEKKKLLEFAFERYFNQSSLIGDLKKCAKMGAELQSVGVDEIACLIDFGVDQELTLKSISYIPQLENSIANSVYKPYVLEKLEELKGAKLAVKDKNTHLSYEDLEENSNCILHSLIKSGVQLGDVVGVCLPRNTHLLATILALFKIGAIYLPLDSSYPEDRIQYMLKDAKAKAVIVSEDTKNSIPANLQLPIETLFLSKEKTDEFASVTPESIAYIIYTSGSTGRPKGVPIKHKSLDNFLKSIQKELKIKPTDKMLALSTVSFDISLLELLLPLTVGAEVYVLEEEAKTNGFYLKNAIEDIKPTVIQATPSTWKMLLRAGWKNTQPLKILSGGEALPLLLANELLENSEEVWNLYGPTEATIWSSASSHKKNEPISIGKPLENIRYYLISEKEGVGELGIGGIALTEGYLNLPEVNKDKFIYLNDANEIIYKTGDLVKKDEKNNYYFLGRNDNRIKLRGYLIELDEIKNVLLEISEVHEAAVTVQKDENDVEHLVCFYVPKDQNKDISLILSQYLHAKLPTHMIPSHMKKMENLPKTANQKIDQKNLPNLFKRVSIELSNEDEKSLRTIWEKLLKVPINSDTQFFKSGGSSLLLTELIVQIEEKFPHHKLAIDTFIRNPSFGFMKELLFGKAAAPILESNSIDKDLKISFLKENNVSKNINFDELDHVLVTGANGFIGSHITHALIQQKVHVYALVRGKDKDESKQKLIKSLKNYKLYSDEMLDHIEIITGDIAEERFGLSDLEYRLLSQSIKAVIHTAASINFLLTYEDLRKTNVLGTQNLINFCLTKQIKPFLFFSSYSVYDIKNNPLSEIFDDTPLTNIYDLRNGYQQTKFVAEKMIDNAMEVGLPALILRPGRSFYSLKRQVADHKNIVIYVEELLKKLQSYPDNLVGNLNQIDVDNISAAVIHLLSNPNAYGKTYNLVEKNSLHWEDLFEYAAKHHPNIKKFPAKDWEELINKKEVDLYPLYKQETDQSFSIEQVLFKHHLSKFLTPWLDNGSDHDQLLHLIYAEVFGKAA